MPQTDRVTGSMECFGCERGVVGYLEKGKALGRIHLCLVNIHIVPGYLFSEHMHYNCMLFLESIMCI